MSFTSNGSWHWWQEKEKKLPLNLVYSGYWNNYWLADNIKHRFLVSIGLKITGSQDIKMCKGHYILQSRRLTPSC